MQKMITITRYHFVTVFPLLCISLHQASERLGHQCSFTSSNNEEISYLKTNLDILRSWDRALLMYSSITNKMQRYTMVFITINALHVSGGSSAHHQELNVASCWLCLNK